MNDAPSTKYTFAPLPRGVVAEPWRPLDRAVAAWVLAHGGGTELAVAAGWASLADGAGHSALPLAGGAALVPMPALDATAQAQIARDALVEARDARASMPHTSATAALAPFVLEQGHLLLRRNFRHEVAVAAQLAARHAAAVPVASAQGAVDALFGTRVDAADAAQRRAVAQVRGRCLFVLTGGPGTGKTSTVLRMLAVLARDRLADGMAPVVRVAAPTGKAAQRIAQALRDGAQALQARLAHQPDWLTALALARDAPAATLHRLLGSLGDGGFRHGRDNRLPADIVVVDEASMIDLALLRRLLDALRDDAVLVLVGDADQLTSVGTGSVLRDIVRVLDGDAALVRLEHSFRADRALVPLNDAARAGDVAAFETACAGAVTRHAPAARDGHARDIARWGRDLREHLGAQGAFAAVDDAATALALLDALRARQLLCALREGPLGAEAVNRLLDASVRAQLDDDRADAAWYRGRAIMVTVNDVTTGLFNGDVGLCLADADGNLRVWFEVAAAAEDGARRAVALSIGSLPAHEGAFAITVHKSQGSEYDHVAVLLPDDADNAVLSRELLYTAVSRARRSLALWASDAVLARALAQPVRRAGLLGQRLAAALGDAFNR